MVPTAKCQGYPLSRNPTNSKRVPLVLDFCENRRKKKKKIIRVIGRRGKEKCKKDNNKKKLFYYFILINSNLIFNYENINVISQNI